MLAGRPSERNIPRGGASVAALDRTTILARQLIPLAELDARVVIICVGVGEMICGGQMPL